MCKIEPLTDEERADFVDAGQDLRAAGQEFCSIEVEEMRRWNVTVEKYKAALHVIAHAHDLHAPLLAKAREEEGVAGWRGASKALGWAQDIAKAVLAGSVDDCKEAQ